MRNHALSQRQLNRANRRQGKGTTSPRRTARKQAQSMMVMGDVAMRPVELIIDQLRVHGHVTTDALGHPIFQAQDGAWYPSDEAIEGLIWHFEMWSTRHAKDLPLGPLRDLHTVLKYGVPIQQKTLDSLPQTVTALRRVIATSSAQDQRDLARQTEIRAVMAEPPEAAQGAQA